CLSLIALAVFALLAAAASGRSAVVPGAAAANASAKDGAPRWRPSDRNSEPDPDRASERRVYDRQAMNPASHPHRAISGSGLGGPPRQRRLGPARLHHADHGGRDVHWRSSLRLEGVER